MAGYYELCACVCYSVRRKTIWWKYFCSQIAHMLGLASLHMPQSLSLYSVNIWWKKFIQHSSHIMKTVHFFILLCVPLLTLQGDPRHQNFNYRNRWHQHHQRRYSVPKLAEDNLNVPKLRKQMTNNIPIEQVFTYRVSYIYVSLFLDTL